MNKHVLERIGSRPKLPSAKLPHGMPPPGLKSQEMKTRLRPGKSKSHKAIPVVSGSEQALTRPSAPLPEAHTMFGSVLEDAQ